MISVRSRPDRLRARLHWLVLSPAARPLRFAGTGGAAGALQLVLLAVLTRHGWDALLANGLAFFVATQMNFTLSVMLTWRDRLFEDTRTRSLLRCWLFYHGSIALMGLVNMLTFSVTRSFLPTLVASLVGIAAGALGNYIAGDRFVFRGRSATSPSAVESGSAA